jgi:hypothetical protein
LVRDIAVEIIANDDLKSSEHLQLTREYLHLDIIISSHLIMTSIRFVAKPSATNFSSAGLS